MRLLFSVSIFLFFISLFSCKKIGNGIVQGTVHEKGTGLPIEGATVTLKFWLNDCSSCNYMYDSVATDSEGKFKIYFKGKFNWRYELYVRENNHYGGLMKELSQKKVNYDLELEAFGYLKIRIKKTSNSNNGFIFSDKNFTEYHHNGSPIDTLFPKAYKIPANRNTTYSWTIRNYPSNPGGTDPFVTYSKNIFVKTGDTLIETISYE